MKKKEGKRRSEKKVLETEKWPESNNANESWNGCAMKVNDVASPQTCHPFGSLDGATTEKLQKSLHPLKSKFRYY